MSEILRIRATRASPLGRARDDPDRRRVYGAALAQFEELMTAAAGSSAASRPLPLFYALSQAGRAIAADRADDPWSLRGHGLIAPDLDGQIVDISVRRQQGKDKAPVDSFAGVARATNTVTFDGAVTIGALWASLPDVAELLPTQETTPMPLVLVPYTETLTSNLFDGQHLHATVVFDGTVEDLVSHLNTHFPTCAGAGVFEPFPGQPIGRYETGYGSGFRFWWPIHKDQPTIQDHMRLLDKIAASGPAVHTDSSGLVFPPYPGFEPRWLRPGVGGIALSSLLTWWTLLFGLSMLARYEPAGWAAVLDVESSELAVPLEQLLDIALDRVPELIFEALTAERN